MMSTWQAAFKYGTLKIPGVSLNPFSQLGKQSPPPRRQQWTNEQLDAFISVARKVGYPSIGRCALMCMELVQRPGDILSMTWGSYQELQGAWYIRQSKRGVEVWVPPTERLKVALDSARRQAQGTTEGDISGAFICPTTTGRRWDRRYFTRIVRVVARRAGIPDDLQIRDLRRTGATEGASAGATPWELMAVGGWQHQASIRPYLVRTAEQAAAFQAKREAYRRRNSYRRRRLTVPITCHLAPSNLCSHNFFSSR